MSTEQLYTIILLNASETRSLAYTNNRYHELDRMGRIANVNLRGVRTEVALKRAIDTAFGEVHQKEIMTNTNGLLRPVESEGGAFIRVIPSNFFTLRVTTRSTPYRFYVRYKANCPLNCTCEPQTPNTPQSPLLGRGSSVASSSPLPTGVFEVNDHSFSLARLLFNRSRGRQDDDDSFFSPDREPTELEKRNEAMKRLNIQVSLWTQSQSRRPFNNPPFKMNSITEDVVPMMLKYFSKSSLNLTSRLDVTGLEGIDGGGVSRHVFTVFFESLKTFKLNGKLPLLEEVGTTGLYILSVLEDSLPYAYEYVPFALGRILAYAIIHRLPLPMYLHVDFFLSLVQATAYMDSNTLIDMPQTAHVNSAFMDTSAPYLVQKYITCETVQDIQMLLEEYEAIKDIQLVQEEEEQTLEGLKDLFVVYDVIGQRRRFVDPFLKGLNPDNLMVKLYQRAKESLEMLLTPLPLNAEMVLECISFQHSNPLIPPYRMRYERCVGYFKDAIRTMTPEELSKLVLFISGSKVLPLTKMTVFFSNHVQDHMPLEYALIPIARTCSLRMEMSSMFFEEQSDLFNKCLLRAMDSMAHSAFQFA